MATSTLESALYRERLPNPYLSKTFQSSFLHTPSYTDRRTISKENYSRKIADDEKCPKTPWGRRYSYGGLGFVQLQGTPHSLDMINLSRGTHHFGSGASQKPRGVTVQQLYSITPSKKSAVRPTDELTPSPTKVNMCSEQIEQKFPAEHPYASHISRTDMFPSTTPPKSPINTAEDKENNATVLLADCPASAPDPTVISKSRGAPYRHELISIPLDSKRKPMTWPNGPTYFQLLKGPDRERNVYYPTPPTQLNPNSLQFKKLSDETNQALQEANRTKWTTTYRRDYYKSNSPVTNLDTEKTLKEITAFPSAEVQTALLHSNIPNESEDFEMNGRSVEELSGEAERKKRVKFVKTNYKNNNINNFQEQLKPLQENKSKKYLLPKSPPMYLQTSRPNSSAEFANKNQAQAQQSNNLTISGIRSKTAPTSCNMMTAAEMLSNTDLHRKFNATYDQPPDLRCSRDGSKTLAERRHHVPEARGTKCYVFDGY